MDVRHPMGILHSFYIKNIFYDKMDLRLLYFHVTKYPSQSMLYKNSEYSFFKQISKFSLNFMKLQKKKTDQQKKIVSFT